MEYATLFIRIFGGIVLLWAAIYLFHDFMRSKKRHQSAFDIATHRKDKRMEALIRDTSRYVLANEIVKMEHLIKCYPLSTKLKGRIVRRNILKRELAKM